MIPESELDGLLLSFCVEHWRKVARVAAHTLQALEDRGITSTGELADQIDARLAALVDGCKLEAQGNIKRWRYSEVRLPSAKTDAADVFR